MVVALASRAVGQDADSLDNCANREQVTAEEKARLSQGH